MKKMRYLFVVGVITSITMASCGPAQKTTARPSSKPSDYILFTTKIQQTLKFTDQQYKELNFYPSTIIRMEGNFFSISAFVEDGVAVIVDTTDLHSRTFDRNTQGQMTGTIQRDPSREDIITSVLVRFTKGDISFDFEFNESGDGTYVLNQRGKVSYEGRDYEILTSNQAAYGERCKLLFSTKKKHVVVKDQQ